MNRKVLSVVMAAACLVGTALPAFAVKVGEQAPGFTLKDAQERSLQVLDSFRGKRIVFLNFFATWCENCQEEMAALKAINEKYKDRGLEVISINVQERSDKVRKFIEKYQLPFTVLIDQDAAIARKYGLVGFPSNIIIDGEGKVRFMDTRPPSDMEKIMQELKGTLRAAKPAVKAVKK